MKERNYGKIINLSSIGAINPPAHAIHYNSAKAGIIGFTYDLARTLASYNICVNAILPGNMEEGMMEFLKDTKNPMYPIIGEPLLKLIPLNNFGTGDDIKGAVVFLASEAGRYLSGAKIVVDGGFTINAGLLIFLVQYNIM